MEIRELCEHISPKTESFVCRDGAELLVLGEMNAEGWHNLQGALEQAGYSCTAMRKELGPVFAGFQKQDSALWLAFDSAAGTVRITVQPSEAPFVSEKAAVCEVPPLLTQIRTGFLTCDCGMSYLIRLGDGRFVVIDGGYGEYEEADRLMDLMNEQLVGWEKPVIAAWFCSHPHADHFLGFMKFMERYREKVLPERAYFTFPTEQACPGVEQSLCGFYQFIDTLRQSGVQITAPRSGQRLVLADAVFDVLYTCEDLYPNAFRTVNDTSLVLRMELAGHRVMWLGDAMAQSSSFICRRYPAECLACDILQVGHHGYDGGSDALYRAIDPEILLWPCPNFWYPVVRLWKSNDFLRSSERIRTTFVSGQEETVLDLTKPIPLSSPYRHTSEGETVYCEHFQGSRVADLNFSCVTGGNTGYMSADVTLRNGSCILDSHYNAYTVCEFVQYGQMDLLERFTLTVSGSLMTGSERFGLFWNYPEHTVFAEEEALWLEPEADGSISFCLQADARKGKAWLKRNGTIVNSFPYDKKYGSGLFLILKNAALQLRSIQLVNGMVEEPCAK